MIAKRDIYDLEEEKVTDYWMSFSDMMASLLLVFILFLTMTMYQVSVQEELLSDKEDEVNKIIGVRKMIVEELKEEFKDSELQIDIDPETGAITFSEGVFFDYNEYKLKDTGKKYLKQFIPQYIKVLLDDKNKDYISEIIIEGHTDKTGSYMYNLELSQKRAFEVAKYVLSDEFSEISREEKEKLRSILTANGRSYSYAIVDGDGEIVAEKSRRVEFKFRLKDEEMIYKMEEILGDENVN
ncbi:OmpA family protein [Sporanaerobacter acetigenes]|uniref:OmpA family protein n=1 Tax=Sporanaerobacter acetigenes TaxID=165813 RepID=UPI00104538C7|nr:OmpA family protein [Sporanaerobacter acetigenes]